ncbi:hypothetical protein ACFVVM_28510 [Nocardia sp. NPDC058176]|uniref:hypothetical protein n=1 Tax=Nocardia sp. NPDC058176 TaxID=3346368 RepID=UPI0036DE9D81
MGEFFRNLVRIQRESREQADVLAGSALDLIGSAVVLASGRRPVDTGTVQGYNATPRGLRPASIGRRSCAEVALIVTDRGAGRL